MVVRASPVGLSTGRWGNNFHIQVWLCTLLQPQQIGQQIGGRLLIANHVDQLF